MTTRIAAKITRSVFPSLILLESQINTAVLVGKPGARWNQLPGFFNLVVGFEITLHRLADANLGERI